MAQGVCGICGFVGKLTKHHSIWPRRQHQRDSYRARYIIRVCRDCHTMIHDLVTCRFNTLDYKRLEHARPGRPTGRRRRTPTGETA